MKKQHTPINQLILDTKDLSMFPIERIITADDKCWRVVDLRGTECKTYTYKTKHNAELAICAVIRLAMK
ncbi:hypothetical protein UFOVP1226_35 [uncultured Caudovirales phage]|uniref:Uncharacterized protein n=1 Tax=uncultured Caudovirales phage TaxID=2100421 RepID=A0A6J5LSQ5_9CAUD|nr:hypothetical protein UFOVP278_6 [uncultured Caudovirales phage]CAB4191390.1 hypothetical protein UFOVP1226_35 [uncultured Caudovirales phage]